MRIKGNPNRSEKVDDMVVIVRSAHERTEELCVQLARKQVPEDRVLVIHERPFIEALRRAFQVGLDLNLTWTLCLDADVLLPAQGLHRMTAIMREHTDTVFGLTGCVLDKYYGGRNQGGPHLYRTSLLHKALEGLAQARRHLRPETKVKALMQAKGYDWLSIDEIFGVHDFEQFYRDIYRKMLVRANKSPRNASRLLTRAVACSSIDQDFLVASWGLRVGINRSENIVLDAEKWLSEAEALLITHHIQEKDSISGGKYLDVADKLVREYHALRGSAKTFFLASNGTHAMHEHLHNPLRNGFAMRIGWLITRFGIKLQRWATNDQPPIGFSH